MKKLLILLVGVTGLGAEIEMTRVSPHDGMPAVLIPAAEFTMGAADDDAFGRTAESPPHRVRLRAYYIDRHEVTQGQFADFLNAVAKGNLGRIYEYVDLANEVNSFSYDATAGTVGVWRGRSRHPVAAVSRTGALEYAKHVRRRLPTEAEWELAARGVDARRYPWGDTWDPKRTVTSERRVRGPAAVGTTPGDRSPYGVLDMAGNVMEWVQDTWRTDFYLHSPIDDPVAGGPLVRGVARGGAWCLTEWDCRTTSRKRQTPNGQRRYLGFRCAEDVPEPLPPAAAVSDDVLFYAPMDGSVHAAAAAGRRHALSVSRPPEYVDGHRGRAALLGEDGDGRFWVDYDTQGNLDFTSGTISMWVQPVGWNGSDPGFRFFFIVRDPDRVRSYLYRFTGGGLTAILGNGVNNEWQTVRYDCSAWQDGQWMHLAMTWTVDTLALFVDGRRIDRRTIPEAYRVRGPAAQFSIGQSQPWERTAVVVAQTAIDEVVIFGRPLSDTEVAAEMARTALP